MEDRSNLEHPTVYMIQKARRFLTMSPREIVFRLGRMLRRDMERIGYLTGRYDWSPKAWSRRLCRNVDDCPATTQLAEWWKRHLAQRQEPAFLLDAKSLQESYELYHKQFASHLNSVIRKADRVCRGEFRFLGLEFRASDPIDWQCDPMSGRSWPSRYHADVNIPFCDGTNNEESPGDSKHVWELNRQEFLIDCAKAYFLTGETRYASRVFQITSDWIQSNPYLQGVNWAGPLEVAIRSLSWLWAFQFCRQWNELPSPGVLELVQSFYQHGTYLNRHVEIYSSPNNHLVGEATALYLLGSFFPEFDEASLWRNRAWNILLAEYDRQFYEDGGSTEQAISYHHYCLGFFLLAILTRLRQGESVPQAMLDRIESAFSFSMWMTTPSGTAPRIGDTDDARSIRFGNIVPWDFCNLLSIGTVLFQRGDLKSTASEFSEDALWLLGPEGYQTFEQIPAKPVPENSRVFSTSGYAILKSGWGSDDHYTCFDGGPIGLNLSSKDIPLFTHGHADMLSMTISAYGDPLLVDSGFYAYNGSPKWHRYTRDVQGHNTVRVDGRSPAKFHRANAWSCVAEPGPVHHESESQVEIVEGSHNGFHKVADCDRHRRVLLCSHDPYWLVLDRLEGSGNHLVEVFFHFAPGQIREITDGLGVTVTTTNGNHAVLQVGSRNPLKAYIFHGEGEPEGGWIASSYGCRQRAPVVCFRGRVEFPSSLTFGLFASREELPDIQIKECIESIPIGESASECSKIDVSIGVLTDTIRFSWKNAEGRPGEHVGGRLTINRSTENSAEGVTSICPA